MTKSGEIGRKTVACWWRSFHMNDLDVVAEFSAESFQWCDLE